MSRDKKSEVKYDEYPDVNLRIYSEGDDIKIKFDKNVGMLKLNTNVALKMADMIKIEAVKILRRKK